MKILMIDDEKSPSTFKKNDKEFFANEEVVVAKNYADGMTELQDNGPWDILLLDWNLKEFTPKRNGLLILSHIHRYKIKIGKIIIITSDEAKAKEMATKCAELKEAKTIEAFSVQTPKGW